MFTLYRQVIANVKSEREYWLQILSLRSRNELKVDIILPIMTSQHKRHNKSLIFLAGLLLFCWFALPQWVQAAPSQSFTQAHLLQITPEPFQTATPLPTLTNLNSGGEPKSYLLFGLLLVCGMGLLLVIGVVAAVFLVRLRSRIGS